MAGKAVVSLTTGLEDPEKVTVAFLVAVTAGIMEAQLSNDPGGNRWTRHLNRLVDLLVDDVITRKGPR